MSFEIKDLAGLGQPLAKLMGVVQAACGKMYEPIHVKRIAAANAQGLRILERAKTEAIVESATTLASLDPSVLIAMQSVPPALLTHAQRRLAHQELGRQQNIDRVIAGAVAALPEEVSEQLVDTSWAKRFFAIAADVDDEQMQTLWGKILAGETARPGRFSLRALEILRNLSQQEASMFARACSLAMGANEYVLLIPPADIRSPFWAPDMGVMGTFGFDHDVQLKLAEAGLFSIGLTVNMPLDQGAQRVLNNGRTLQFERATAEDMSAVTSHRFGSTGPDFNAAAFTTAGRSLATLIADDFQPDYFNLLSERYLPLGVKITQL